MQSQVRCQLIRGEVLSLCSLLLELLWWIVCLPSHFRLNPFADGCTVAKSCLHQPFPHPASLCLIFHGLNLYISKCVPSSHSQLLHLFHYRKPCLDPIPSIPVTPARIHSLITPHRAKSDERLPCIQHCLPCSHWCVPNSAEQHLAFLFLPAALFKSHLTQTLTGVDESNYTATQNVSDVSSLS